MIKRVAAFVAFALALLPASLAMAEYPDHPVRIIVGYGAGSGVDVTGRLFAKGLSAKLGQSFVVENRPGAASSVAALYVVRSEKDGYTLFMATSSNVANSINPNLGFDFAKDFAPVMLTTRMPFILVATPSLPANNVSELIALARSKPGEVFYGSTGIGGTAHLTGEFFNMKTGAQLTHVPYQGSAQAISDLIAGRISVMFLPVSTVATHIGAGTLKALATTSAKRTAILPNVPTVGEAGLPDFEINVWDGLVAPVGTPPDIVARLNNALNDTLKELEILALLKKQGMEAGGGTSQEFADFIAAETKKWMGVAERAGLKK